MRGFFIRSGMKKYRASKVFVPGGMPQHTYIERTGRHLEERLRQADDNLCKLLTLTGSTKSGKTVLANKIFPRTNDGSIWIDGGTISSEEDLWKSILSEIGGYDFTEESVEIGETYDLFGELEGEAGIPLIAKGKGKAGTGLHKNAGNSKKKSLNLSHKSAAINQLKETGRPLIVDDFHYLERGYQGNIIRALKPLVFEGHAVVLIAIPHRRYDAVKVEREMTGRLENVSVPSWTNEELAQIPNIGFPLLNVKIARSSVEKMTTEAYGSPHLIQEFCRQLCNRHNISETLPHQFNINTIDENLFKSIAEGTGKIIFDKLAKGPRQRSDRLQRPLKNYEKADIYRVVLLALSRLAPGMEKIDYEQLRSAIKEILTDKLPQAHEVSRVLKKMSEIASSDEASTPVIDWQEEDQQLHNTDPFFAFFLKWGINSLNK